MIEPIIDVDFQNTYLKIISTINSLGTTIGKQHLISPLIFELKDPTRCLVNLKKHWKWCFIEGINRLSYIDEKMLIDLKRHRNPGCAAPFRPTWNRKLAAEGGEFDYSYGEIYAQQIPFILKVLRNKSAKEAIMNVWSADHLINGESYKRRPCTLTLHFVPIKGKLDLHVHMRTSDVANLLPYDVFHHTLLQRYIATESGYELGSFWFYADTAYFQKKRKETGNIDRLIQTLLNTNHLNYSRDWKFGNAELMNCIEILDMKYFENGKTHYLNADTSEFGKNYTKSLLHDKSNSIFDNTNLLEFELIKISR